MTAAVIYARISKDDAGTRLGVDRQERLCRQLAERDGLKVVNVLVDKVLSAFRRITRRPAFERLVEMLRGGEAQAVLAYHADVSTAALLTSSGWSTWWNPPRRRSTPSPRATWT